MKRVVAGTMLFFLSACASVPENHPEQKEKYITKKSGYVVDMCAQENMPRFKYRPRRPTKSELSKLDDDEIDRRMLSYIDALEDHISHLENVIVDTRLRVERCK